ncbi:MAG: hypothetical protein JNG83_03070 [Opitutaceae bacterium]|nr:hypothetical protein [Opitutaceae bacterium]
MRRYVLLVALAAVVAAGSYALTRHFAAPRDEDQAAWLRREFALTDDQAAAISRLQADYQPVCAEHCRLIQETRTRLAAAPSDPALRAEIARLERICNEATLGHLRGIAAQMAPEQGRRFLALVEPKVSRHQHAGPLGLK